ncbi:MAG: replication-associated recombination protein A [Minisyncoccia bacterium]
MNQSSMFDEKNNKNKPLADRMRPQNLDDFLGQEHILGKGKLLRELIEKDEIRSMIFWGPPGVGKTTLAMIIANITNSKFITFSAVLAGIKEIKEIMLKAEKESMYGIKTVIFIDEIHRFNKAQQDAFLPYVEKGSVILIGATTENPSFEVNSALLSRSKVFVLKPLTSEDLYVLLKRAISDKEKGLGMYNIEIDDTHIRKIVYFSNGDARVALNTLEVAVYGSGVKDGKRIITDSLIEEAMQKKMLIYDKNGEEHYNLISAFHKSLRNSDSDAAVYWMARMLEAGEDPLYIARRMIRFASEDIGLADPKALDIAVAVFNACNYIGMPECGVNLAQGAIYLSLAPKSNAVYTAYNEAIKDAQNTISESVPMHLRNAPTKLMQEMGYNKGYKYAHDFKEKVADMECLPNNLVGRNYYRPLDSGFEKDLIQRVEYIKKIKNKV